MSDLIRANSQIFYPIKTIYRRLTVLKLGGAGAVARAGVSFKVLQHDELPALLALLRPAATVVLVLSQAPHLHVCRAPLTESRPLGAVSLLKTRLSSHGSGDHNPG